ncbi:glutamine synthetase [Longispora fulva]|uniref:Glutamine synthetase n=1 Tax=Longispora fulva TaxID=619741 RepID=A0A8J7KH23_9ACTN|nr:glutamine synthetase [Longispora fulva]MBG6135499.1 glutamine synthetase [Longispora fulva]GIG56261.1 glutamine synthetase [Longispora fulva]
MDREEARVRGARAAAELSARDIRAVAVTWVDNAGVTRVKGVPTGRLAQAAAWGVGASPVFDVFLVDDSTTTSAHVGGPVGDLRLHPDLDQLTPLAAQPGWAWAPADKWTQEGVASPTCQRGFARRAVERAAAAGLTFSMAFEVEWFVGAPDGTPACAGSAYGMNRLVAVSDYLTDLLETLDHQGVPVEQLHPEYAAGQFELSVAPADPVAAADLMVLVRQTIRAVSARHGFGASFAPVVVPDRVGNGAHLHFSAHADGVNLFAGGPGPHGMTARGEGLLAAVLSRVPALVAIGAPSVSSHLRLVPQRWAGAYQCWGLENREAVLRFVTGPVGARDTAANAELKCVDGSANPYLVVGAVIAAALGAGAAGAGAGGGAAGGVLPQEVTVDPATLAAPPPRLPESVAAALDALDADDALPAALGPELYAAYVAVHRAEAELFDGWARAEIAEAVRWTY